MTLDEKKIEHERLLPKDIPPEYYGFSHYVTKERMITYWHQVDEILALRVPHILEVGIGNGIVSSILKCYGVRSTTVDINESLQPDVVAPIHELEKSFSEGDFKLVLCARVLQHLPFSDFDRAISQLRHVTASHVLLTLPVETLRFYARFRFTGRRPCVMSLPFPLALKRLLSGSVRVSPGSRTQNFWKINQRPETSLDKVQAILHRYFNIEKYYRVPEDMSHAFFVLRKR